MTLSRLIAAIKSPTVSNAYAALAEVRMSGPSTKLAYISKYYFYEWRSDMRKTISTAILLGLACSAAIAGPKEDALLVVERWTQAFTVSDVDAIVGLYATDAVFMGTGTKTIVTQPETIKKYFEATLVSNRKFVASLVDSSVVALNDSTVVVTGLDKLSMTVDGKTQDLFGRVTFVLSKRESGWKIVHFHRSAMPG